MTRTLAVALLLAVLVAVWQWREATAADGRAAIANGAARASQQAQRDEAAARATERSRADRLQEALDAAHTLRLAAEADARRAAAADRGLRGELDRLASRSRAAASDSSAAAEREAALAAIPVLTDMLGQCSEQRGDLARYADDARVAGLTCQRAYDSLTQE